TPQVNPFQQNMMNPFFGNMFGMFGMMGMGMNQFGNMGGNFGMMGAGAPPVPVAQGGPADIQTANTIEFFPPAMALIIRAPSRIHTSITGGIIGGKSKRIEAGAMIELERKGGVLAQLNKKLPNIKVAPAQGGDPDGLQFAKNGEDLDPTKIWN